MKVHKILLPLLVATAAPAVWAQGSPEAGQQKSAPCVACHGVDGNSVNPQWPSIAGQHPTYIVEQLKLFKTGVRQDPLMTPQAQPLSEEDMQDLAAYYSQQKRTGGEADPAKVDLGRRLYRGGDPQRGVTACIACHGPKGLGNPAARFPVVSGQHATYVAGELRAYREGTRETDPNQMMRNVASGMTDEQIDAVAAYVQGLR